MPKLSKRLSLIATFVPQNANVCDIGTDHGYLAIELIKSGKASSVIAADIAEKPLENAKKNIALSGLSNISTRLCDGLSGILPDEVDTIIIAGMGGEVIADILKKGTSVAKQKSVSIVLQPTTSPEVLRRFLYSNGYEIIKETALQENKKLYSVMLVKYTGNIQALAEYSYYIGKLLPDSVDSVLYIKKQLHRAEMCKASLANIENKKEDFLYYESLFNGINSFLKTFNGEDINGI